MAMLYPCPRCAQALPSTAAFCRRCGTAVSLVKPRQAVSAAKQPSTSPLFLTLFIAGIIFVGAVFWRMSAMPTTVPTPVQFSPAMNPTYDTTVIQPPNNNIYGQPMLDPGVTMIRPLVVQPAQPIHVDDGQRFREHNDGYRGGYHPDRNH